MATAGTAGPRPISWAPAARHSPSRRRRRLRRRAPPLRAGACTTSSRRSPTPRPCSALTIAGSPSPRPANSQASASRRSESTLFATTMTGPPLRRTSCATAASSPVTPVVASSTNSTRSDSRAPAAPARSPWCRASRHARRPRRCRRRETTARSTRTRSSSRSRVTPGRRLDDGDLAADEAVHERRLADVRPADDGHDRQAASPPAGSSARLECPAQRGARRSATTSTGRAQILDRATRR